MWDIVFAVGVNASGWMAILKQLQLDPSSFLSSCSHQLLSLLLSNMASDPQACLLALRSLLALQEDVMMAALAAEVCRLLGEEQVVGATSDDMEIMRTPEGELWHVAMRKQ